MTLQSTGTEVEDGANTRASEGVRHEVMLSKDNLVTSEKIDDFRNADVQPTKEIVDGVLDGGEDRCIDEARNIKQFCNCADGPKKISEVIRRIYA